MVHVTHMGTLPGYGLVWYNEDDIAKILYMENVIKKYPVFYDRNAGDKFILQKANKKLIFNRNPPDL